MQTISVQPITNTNVAGKGKAYRITPHGLQFNKEVTISFSYSSEDIKRTIPEALSIAYQDDTGVWQAVGGATLDKQNNKVRVGTLHFSDWSFFERFWIEPSEARIDLGAQIELKVVSVDAQLLAPLPKGEERPIGEAAPVQDSFIKEWHLADEGILGGMKNAQIYQAPDKMPAKNPVAVSAELNLGGSGKYLLVSNITVGNPPHISYLQVDEGLSEVLIFGSGFASGDRAPEVTIDGVPVQDVSLYGPTLIKCWIPAEGKGSSGPVVVKSGGVESTPHILNEWNGTVVYSRPCAGKIGGDLYQKIYFKIRLRGDANPDVKPGESLSPIIKHTKLNAGSKAFYEAGGRGQSSYTQDGCATETVVWTQTTGEVPYYFGNEANRNLAFTGEIETPLSGFIVSLDFIAREVVPTQYTLVTCTGHGSSKQYKDAVEFTEFNSVDGKVKLLFKENSSLSGGKMVRSTGVARGLHWDFDVAKNNIAEATLSWNEIPAKYPNGVIVQ
jgi:hypothetical protein